jgi:hypothetical protein
MGCTRCCARRTHHDAFGSRQRRARCRTNSAGRAAPGAGPKDRKNAPVSAGTASPSPPRRRRPRPAASTGRCGRGRAARASPPGTARRWRRGTSGLGSATWGAARRGRSSRRCSRSKSRCALAGGGRGARGGGMGRGRGHGGLRGGGVEGSRSRNLPPQEEDHEALGAESRVIPAPVHASDQGGSITGVGACNAPHSPPRAAPAAQSQTLPPVCWSTTSIHSASEVPGCGSDALPLSCWSWPAAWATALPSA